MNDANFSVIHLIREQCLHEYFHLTYYFNEHIYFLEDNEYRMMGNLNNFPEIRNISWLSQMCFCWHTRGIRNNTRYLYGFLKRMVPNKKISVEVIVTLIWLQKKNEYIEEILQHVGEKLWEKLMKSSFKFFFQYNWLNSSLWNEKTMNWL